MFKVKSLSFKVPISNVCQQQGYISQSLDCVTLQGHAGVSNPLMVKIYSDNKYTIR